MFSVELSQVLITLVDDTRKTTATYSQKEANVTKNLVASPFGSVCPVGEALRHKQEKPKGLLRTVEVGGAWTHHWLNVE